MERNKLILIVIAIILIIAFIFLIIFLSPKEENGEEFRQKQSEEVTIVVSKEDYEKSVRDIMSDYFGSESLNTDEKQNVILKTREDLLELTVPVEYKDLHLGLVIGLDFITQGLLGDEEKLEQGYEKINNLLESYPWLR